MIESISEYFKKTVVEYRTIVNLLIISIFFKYLLYMLNLNTIFNITNTKLSLKEILIFSSLSFSFSSIIFIFLLFSIVLFSFIKNIFKIKGKHWIHIIITTLDLISFIYIYTDLKVFKLLGVHLDDKIAIKAFNKNALKNDLSLNLSLVISQLIKPIIIFSILIISYFVLKYLLKNKKMNHISNIPKLIVYPIVISIFFSIYLWSKMNTMTSLVPIWSFIKTGDMINKIESKYDNNIKNIKLIHKNNIVIILSESFRKDVFNIKNMPNMFKFIKINKKNIILPKHNFSGAHFTLYSIFSIWYSIWSYNYRVFTSFTKYKDAASMKLFKKLGYKRIFLTTSHILEYDEAFKQVTKQFNIYKEFDTDKQMLLWFRNYHNKELKNDKPYIVFLFLYSSHYNYRYPKKLERYLPVLENNSKDLKKSTFKMNKRFKKQLFNRYKNSVLYIDFLFKKILSIFDSSKIKNTIIVFTGDHGEQFWEHGLFGHASRVYTKETIEVPLMMYFPNLKQKVNINLSSHVDILPTIIDYLTNITKKQIRKYFNGLSLLNRDRHNYIIVSSLEPIGSSDGKFCLINNNSKLVFKTTKLTNNAKFIPLKFSSLDDKKINNSYKKTLLKQLEKFENEYFRFFIFKK